MGAIPAATDAVSETTSLAALIELVCLLEATARKPGNVHPGASFVDLTYADFVRAAAAVAEPLSLTGHSGIGPAILAAQRATRAVCDSNVNLGICLLLAPIAAVESPRELRSEVARLVDGTTVEDAAAVYEAIRLAVAGGLGEVAEQDVAQAPTVTLVEAMALAEERDAIAYEWTIRFRGLDRDGAQWLRTAWEDAHLERLPRGFESGPAVTPWECALIATHLEYLAQGETLIRRKCGREIEREAMRRAQHALAAGAWRTPAGWQAIHELDGWLRADGHRRNPGTTADFVAASALWCLRRGWITPPTKAALLAHATAISESAP